MKELTRVLGVDSSADAVELADVMSDSVEPKTCHIHLTITMSDSVEPKTCHIHLTITMSDSGEPTNMSHTSNYYNE